MPPSYQNRAVLPRPAGRTAIESSNSAFAAVSYCSVRLARLSLPKSGPESLRAPDLTGISAVSLRGPVRSPDWRNSPFPLIEFHSRRIVLGDRSRRFLGFLLAGRRSVRPLLLQSPIDGRRPIQEIRSGNVCGTVVLSAHADDAALSLGGSLLLGSFAAPVTLVTIFGRSNFMNGGFHGDHDLVTNTRRDEDHAFADRLGIQLRFLEFPEAGLRPLDSGDNLFAPDPSEAITPPEGVEEAVNEIVIESAPDVVLAPLGLGDHRDHVITQRQGRRIEDSGDARVAYYEDLPYAASLSLSHIRRRARAIDPRLTSRSIPISDTMERKLGLLDLYASQLGRKEKIAVLRHAQRGILLRRLIRAVSCRARERIWSRDRGFRGGNS